MASLNQVSIELKVSGERQATKALKDFAEANKRVGSSVAELGRKVSSIEGEYRKINELNKQGVVGDDARRTAIGKLAKQLADLTGRTEEEASAALRSAEKTRAKAEADERAAKAAEQHARAQKNLEGSVLRNAQAVNQAVSRMKEMNRLQSQGVVKSEDMAQAELEVARALARTNGYLKSNGALNTQKALAELKAAQATQEAAAVEARANAERQRAQQSYNQLRASIDQSYAARMRLRQAAQTLRAAEQQGIITREQAIAQLREYRTVAQQAAIGTQFASRKLNAMGVVTQQTGYQVGDFLVQIQSGTNAFVAFGQQATQLVGILPMFASRLNMSVGTLIGVSSALGILIPLATALGAAFMRTRDSARDTESAIDQLENAVSGYENAVKTLRSSQSELNEEFGTFSEYALFVAERLRLNAINEANEQITSLANNLTDVSELMGRTIPSSINRSIREFLDLNEGIKDNNRLIADFVNAQIRLDRAEGPKQQADALRELSELFVSIVGSQDQMNEEQEQYYLSLVQAIELVSRLGASQENINDTLRERATIETTIANMQREVNAGVQQILDFRDAEKQSLQDQIALQLIGNQYGEDSAEYSRLKRQQEEEAYRQYLSQNDILGNNQEEMVAIWRAAQNLREESEKVSGILSQISGLDMPITARINALAGALGIAANEAARLINNLPVGVNYGDPSALSGMDGISLLPPFAGPRPPARPDDIDFGYNPPSGRGGGGGGTPDWMSQILSPEMQAAIEAAVEQTKEYEKEVSLLDDALQQGLITQQEYNSYVAQAQEAYNQSAEAANQYEDIILRMANTTSDAIGQAMMDIVTGTKSASDAFSDMAQIILKKAFELLVINPIINSIFGGSGLDISGFNPLPSILDENANGGVFQGGAKVQAFATGGVVGSPTFFPMANGNVGLMGEAGPEAIMPLKRGKGGRLGVEVSGEQGNVVINQTFAFQANGDDSVKRIIASEAPKIAALTQKQMLDARRRGGVVRDTFA